MIETTSYNYAAISELCAGIVVERHRDAMDLALLCRYS